MLIVESTQYFVKIQHCLMVTAFYWVFVGFKLFAFHLTTYDMFILYVSNQYMW